MASRFIRGKQSPSPSGGRVGKGADMLQCDLMLRTPLRGKLCLIWRQYQHTAALIFRIDTGGGIQHRGCLTEHAHAALREPRDSFLIIPRAQWREDAAACPGCFPPYFAAL